jgi:activator of 2-hydroxyglutaryl-CoA dehydratase
LLKTGEGVQSIRLENQIEALVNRISGALAALPVRKGSVLGLDVGSGPCGFALLEDNEIIHCGIRLFDTASLNHKNESKQHHR